MEEEERSLEELHEHESGIVGAVLLHEEVVERDLVQEF